MLWSSPREYSGATTFYNFYEWLATVYKTICLHADDTVLVYAAKTTIDIEEMLQQDLTLVYNWLKQNRLHLNAKKTKWNLIGTYQKLARAQDISLSMKCQQLEKS